MGSRCAVSAMIPIATKISINIVANNQIVAEKRVGE